MPRKNSGFKLAKMMDFISNLVYFDPDDPIFITNFEPGPKKTKLLVVTGSNATGKSFFGRLVAAYCKTPKAMNNKIECIRVGMEIRATEGFHRAFVLQGMESEESTGVNSVHMLRGALRTAKSREHDNILVIDEPDIGLSEAYSVAMGEYIAKEMDDLSPLTKLVVLITHSRHIVEALLPFKPAHLRFGDLMTLEEWVEFGPPPKSVEDLLNLPNQSREIWRRILKAIRDKD
jgi:hypothetical protein